MDNQREWWTVEQVATTLQVNPETVRRWVRSGRLRGGLPGGNRVGYRIRRDDLAAFVAEWYGKSLDELTPGQEAVA